MSIAQCSLRSGEFLNLQELARAKTQKKAKSWLWYQGFEIKAVSSRSLFASSSFLIG